MISLILIIFSLTIVILSYVNLPPYLPIYNSLSWGYSRVGQKLEIFIPIFISLLFFGINIFVGRYVYRKTALLARMSCATTGIVSFISTFFIVKIILLVH